MEIKEAIANIEYARKWLGSESDFSDEALDMAISALEKQEQSNAQNVNSTHTYRPNALESLNILERAKDNKGCVPMSLVRQAFRNILEQDRWHPVAKEGNPKENGEYLVTRGFIPYLDIVKKVGDPPIASDIVAWRNLPEPYTEKEA